MSGNLDEQQRLLHSLAEELKLPFLQIARQAELRDPGALTSISHIADMSLRLLEGYTANLGHVNQSSLQIEPVAVSSVLYDTAHVLNPFARQYNCDIELHIAGKYGPVLADKDILRTALTLLGYNMIGASPTEKGRHRLILAVHRSQKGLVTGFYDSEKKIHKDALRRGKALAGTARQTLPAALSNSGAGLYIANSLLEMISPALRIARHQKLFGLATTLPLSKQLSLV